MNADTTPDATPPTTPVPNPAPCRECGGTGVVWSRTEYRNIDCPTCNGVGR